MSVTDITAGEIITKFELQVSDLTELSSAEELDLLNDKAQDVAMERPWETLKKKATGALAYDSSVAMWYITKPTDFSFFCENNSYTDNSLPIENNAAPRVIFVGVNYSPYQIINFSDRQQYRNQSNVCYLDLEAGKIYFPAAPADTSFYQFDYIKLPPLMTATTETPDWLPNRFRKMLAFAMAVDDDILQKSPKAQSYAPENRAKYQDTLARMNFWNDQHYQN